MKEIYINGRDLTGEMAGIHRFCVEIIKELSKTMKVIVVCPRGVEETIENVEYIHLDYKASLYFEQLILPRFLRKRKVKNLLSLGNSGPVFLPGSCIIHDILMSEYPNSYSLKVKIVFKIINKLNVKRYKTIYTVSNFSKKRIMHFYPKIKKDIVVLSSAATQWTDVVPKEVKLPFEGRFYFSLSVIREYKNFQYILNLAKANPDKNFVCTGIKDKMSSIGDIPNNVYFTGYLQDEEIKYLYQNCEAFIMPSLLEGFGLPPLEAIVCGCKKIILSDIEVFREIYFTGANFIDVNKVYNLDELDLIEVNEEQRKQLMDKYSWSNIAKKIEETWE